MFLNVTMLAGLAGALVPLVLHLLSRSRYRTVDWGAMLFLEGADARVMQSARIKQIVILLLRMGMVATLAMALAQPVVRGRFGGLPGEARVGAVILLDCSASMGQDENGKTRLELARGTVLNILESMRNSRVSIVLLGARDNEQLSAPTTDLQQLAQRVIALSAGSGRADMAWGLERAAEILDQMGESGRELYVVCDKQASNWKSLEEPGLSEHWRARLQRAGTPLRFFVVPVGSEKSENLAIESIELINPPAVVAQPAEVEVKIRNFGHTPRGNVELKIEDKTTVTTVGADATSSVRVPVRLYNPGSRLLTASLSGAGPGFDDRMQAAVDVIEPIRVLVVSGDERGLPLQNESDFVRIALAPRAAEAKQKGAPTSRGDLCSVQVEPFENWNEENLRTFQVVILANVPELTPTQALTLEQFVYEGGGLFIAPGNLTRVENYNTLLYRAGTGIMPARLLSPTAEDGSEATSIQGISDFDHPVMRFLKGKPDPIPLVTIGRYFPVEGRVRDARVLAQYASGKPMVVESTAGRGRVLLTTTPLDADWGTLPLSSFYLPFVQSAVRHLTAGLVAERNLLPGAPIVARFGPGMDVTSGEVIVPAGEGAPARRIPLPVTRGEVRFSGTQQPGTYLLLLEGSMPAWAKRISFVVHTPVVESDLTPLSAVQWKDLARRWGFERIDPAQELIAGVVTASRRGRELWLTLIGAVIVLGIVELALAGRWSGEAAR